MAKSTKITSGKIAGRSLSIVGKTRPPLLRIRKCIFDILVDVSGQTVLDLCAGSGSFGIEAISRGASYAYFVEENIETLRNLVQNLQNLSIFNAKVMRVNVNFLPSAHKPVDLIFFDPPFGHTYIENVTVRLLKKGWTHSETLLVLRTDHEIAEILGWTRIDLREIGVSWVHFYRASVAIPSV